MSLHEQITAKLDELEALARTAESGDVHLKLDWPRTPAKDATIALVAAVAFPDVVLRAVAADRRVLIRHIVRPGWPEHVEEGYPWRCVQCSKAYREPWCDDIADLARRLGVEVA